MNSSLPMILIHVSYPKPVWLVPRLLLYPLDLSQMLLKQYSTYNNQAEHDWPKELHIESEQAWTELTFDTQIIVVMPSAKLTSLEPQGDFDHLIAHATTCSIEGSGENTSGLSGKMIKHRRESKALVQGP